MYDFSHLYITMTSLRELHLPEDLEYQIEDQIIHNITEWLERRCEPKSRPSVSRLTGRDKAEEYLALSERLFQDVARMSKRTFGLLRDELVKNGGILESMVVSADMALFMVLQLIGQSSTTRQLRQDWQVSSATVNLHVNRVTIGILGLVEQYIDFPGSDEVEPEIAYNEFLSTNPNVSLRPHRTERVSVSCLA